MHPRTTRFQPVLLCLLLALLTLALYSPVDGFDFVNYDDPVYVTENPAVLNGLSAEGVRWAFTAVRGSNWHPMTWLSHMADVQVFGKGARGPHWVNVFLHAANAILLFLVLYRVTGASWRSALVAALFAWHPLHVESVAWISERKDVLSTFFFLLTLWFYAEHARARPSESAPRRAVFMYVAAFLCFLLGLLSKPMLVTLPFLLLVLDVWPLQRISLRRDAGRDGAALLWEKWPFFALSFVFCLVTFWAQKKGGAVASLDHLPLEVRAANAVVAYATYLHKMVWPTDLAVFYPHPGLWPWGVVTVSAILLTGITAAVIWQAKARPWLLCGWLWYVGTLVPVIGLVQVGDQAYADRYTYVPLIGIFVAIAWEAHARCSGRPRFTFWTRLTLAMALLACCMLTHRQLQHWRSAEWLFRHALTVTRNNYVAHNNLANALVTAGRLDEARFHFESALTILPSYEAAHLNLGNLLLDQGQTDQAISHFLLATKFKPDSPEGFYNLATALSRQDRDTEALEQFAKALTLQPNHTNAHYNLGIALTKLGRLPEAEAHFRRALELNPHYGFAHYNLGLVLNEQGRVREAGNHFRQAVLFSPEFPPARNELGAALLAMGQYEEAIVVYREALEITPNGAPAHNNLGLALARQGRPDLALPHFQAVVRLEPQNADAHYNVANVLTELGQLPEAASHYAEALRLNPADERARQKLVRIRERLSGANP